MPTIVVLHEKMPEDLDRLTLNFTSATRGRDPAESGDCFHAHAHEAAVDAAMWHSHEHVHEADQHAHPHQPDLHHRHGH